MAYVKFVDMKRVWANPLISFPERKLQTNKNEFRVLYNFMGFMQQILGVLYFKSDHSFKKNRICPSLSLYLLFLVDATEGNWSDHLIIHYTAVIPVKTSLPN
jgi:hypothetical protein